MTACLQGRFRRNNLAGNYVTLERQNIQTDAEIMDMSESWIGWKRDRFYITPFVPRESIR